MGAKVDHPPQNFHSMASSHSFNVLCSQPSRILEFGRLILSNELLSKPTTSLAFLIERLHIKD